MANCPQCNTPYDAGAVFCDNCGASLQAPAPAAAGYPPQPTVQAAPPIYQQPPAQQPTAYQPPTPQPVYQAPAPGGANCPQCGSPLTPGAAFCDNCGAPAAAVPPVYQQPPVPPVYQQPPAQPAYQQPPAPPVYQQPPVQPAYQQPPAQPAYGAAPTPRLIVQTTNAQIMLPPGKMEYIVGREDPVSNIFPDVDMTPHGGDDGGVSRRHARLFFQNGQWFVEDFQSTNFTHVNNQRVQPGTPMPVPNGAEVRFGRIKLMFYTQ